MERSKRIVFVTSNDGKLASAKRLLKSTEVVRESVDFIEPRSDDIKEIAYQKVLQAHKLLGAPCIAEDSAFIVEALNGFPGTYVNHFLTTIGIKGLLKLMDGVANRNCMFLSCLAYYDGEELRYFESESHGQLTMEVRGDDSKEKWSDLWNVFVPEGFDIAFSEFTDADFEIYYRTKSISSFEKFAKWYEE